ncbi:MAG: guanylate kinase [Clostridiales bacterium]|nr:guanylate kinase [Clostridiales bacterium]
MSNKGLLAVLSGFAGSGKGTIMKKLLEKYPEDYALSVSATTRHPRPGEEEGREYFFKTEEEFKEMICSGELLEYAGYVGHHYGTPRAYVEDQLSLGKNVILEIEIQGALQIKEKFPDTLLMFVTPPSAVELMNRLKGRGTETEEEIIARLSRAVEEADGCEAYDYLIINDDIDESVANVHRIIESEQLRMRRCLPEIEAIKNDLRTFLKEEEK